MFESLSKRLSDAFRKLAGTARIDEGNVDGALKEVRQALLEADVHYKVVQDLLKRVRERALGADVPRGLAPDQVLAKLVQDELAAMMGGAGPRHLAWASLPPTVILLCGLQGTGKTTTAAKLARRLMADGRKVALAAADLQRPAAVEQLKVLAKSIGAEVFTAQPGEAAPALAARAKREALQAGFDALIVDTAGRLAIDETLMAELKAVKAAVQPHEILLVLDAMQGQDALPTATRFHETVGVDGLVLTKLDGDARGGAALSALAVTGKPVKFLGTGEKTDALEAFHPERLAGRILGMGDVVGLVERVQAQVDADEAARLAKKAAKQGLDLQDLLDQFLQLKKMGSLKELAAMIPGAGKALGGGDMDEGRLKRNIAALQSMTAKERRRPEIIHGERRKRIAKGSGTRVEDVNQLLRMHEQMRKMMKKMSQGGRRRGGFGMPGAPGGRFPGLPGF